MTPAAGPSERAHAHLPPRTPRVARRRRLPRRVEGRRVARAFRAGGDRSVDRRRASTPSGTCAKDASGSFTAPALQRLVPVGGGDRIEVETHVCDCRRVRSLRRYVVRKGAVEIAHATTDWVYCDSATGRPSRVAEALQQAFLPDGRATGHVAARRRAACRATAGGRGSSRSRCSRRTSITSPTSTMPSMRIFSKTARSRCLRRRAGRYHACCRRAAPCASSGSTSEHRSDAQVGEMLIVRSWLAASTAVAARWAPARRARSCS